MPRSGHHLLVNCLLKYYSENLSFPETHGHRTFSECREILHAGDFHYCEYYNHCRSMPCTDSLANFQKNHDFQNKVQNLWSNYYIIQYRHPLEHLIVLYEYSIIKGHELDKEVYDDKKRWLDFVYGAVPSKKKIKKYLKYWIKRISFMPDTPTILYWKNFANKWIINNKNPNTYFLPNSDFIQSPIEKLEEVIRFIDLQKSVNVDFLKEILTKIPMQNVRDITKFKFFTPRFFKKIERFLSDEMQKLNLRRTYF